jgi:predicted alpha/beta superfamily hydrolase
MPEVGQRQYDIITCTEESGEKLFYNVIYEWDGNSYFIVKDSRMYKTEQDAVKDALQYIQ